MFVGEKLAYGILVRDKEDYDYFRDAFLDNRLPLSTTQLLAWNKRDERVGQKEKLFDPSSDIFREGMIVLVCSVGCIMVFGVAYETRRRGYYGRSKSLSPKAPIEQCNSAAFILK